MVECIMRAYTWSAALVVAIVYDSWFHLYKWWSLSTLWAATELIKHTDIGLSMMPQDSDDAY